MSTINSVGNGLAGASGTGSFAGTTSPTFVTPTLGAATATSVKYSGNNAMIDSNGNKILTLLPQSSAVNNLSIQNAAMSVPPVLVCVGSDTNIGMSIAAKGTGQIQVYSAATTNQVLFAYGAANALNAVFSFTGTGTGNSYTFPTAVGTVAISGAAQAVTFASTTFSSTSGIIGTTTNDNAAAGSVGQFISSVKTSGSAVTFSSGAVTDLTSIALTAGDWDVWGNLYAAGTTITAFVGWINSASATPTDSSLLASLSLSVSTNAGATVPGQRFSLSGNTTIYISGVMTGTGTITVAGGIYARRVR